MHFCPLSQHFCQGVATTVLAIPYFLAIRLRAGLNITLLAFAALSSFKPFSICLMSGIVFAGSFVWSVSPSENGKFDRNSLNLFQLLNGFCRCCFAVCADDFHVAMCWAYGPDACYQDNEMNGRMGDPLPVTLPKRPPL
jgi:hypothetical protein